MAILWLYKDKQKQNKLGNSHLIIGRIVVTANLTKTKLQAGQEDPTQSLASLPQSWDLAKLLQSLQTLLLYTWLLRVSCQERKKITPEEEASFQQNVPH